MPLWNRVIRAGSRELAGGVEPRAAEGDVVALPLAGRARGVGQRRVLAVDRPGLAVGVGLGPVGVEHLDLELAHQEDAAVAAVLAGARRAGSARPTRRGAGCRRTVAFVSIGPAPGTVSMEPFGHLPPGGPAAGRLPGVEARPVEQDDRILRRPGRDRYLGGLDHRRPRAADVVLPPSGRGRAGADLLGGQAGQQPGGRDQAGEAGSWGGRGHGRRLPGRVDDRAKGRGPPSASREDRHRGLVAG